jgi:hypothetical protein
MAFSVLATVIYGVASYRMWIVHVGDSLCFLPVAFFESRFSELINPYFNIGDATYHERLVWHGWAQPFLLARIALDKTYGGVSAGLAILTGANLAIFIALLRRINTKSSVAILGAVLCLFDFYLSGGARPELLASLIVTTAAWYAIAHTPTPLPAAVLGKFLGLLVITHPLGAVMAAVFLAAYWAYACPSPGMWFRCVLIAGAVAAFVAMSLSALLYPYPLTDWIHGIVKQGQLRSQIGATPVVPFYFGALNIHRTAWILTGTLAAAFGIAAAFQRTRQRLLFAALVATTGFVFWYAGVAYPQYRYNLDLFLPLYCAAACMALPGLLAVRSRSMARAAAALGILLVAGSAFSLTKSGVELFAAATRKDWVSLHTLSSRVKTLQSEAGPEHVAVSYLFEVAVDDLPTARRAVFGTNGPLQQGLPKDFSDDKVPPRLIAAVIEYDFEYIVLSQAFSGLSAPPAVDNFDLVEDTFATPASVLGFPLGNTPKAYNYAVYRRHRQ